MSRIQDFCPLLKFGTYDDDYVGVIEDILRAQRRLRVNTERVLHKDTGQARPPSYVNEAASQTKESGERVRTLIRKCSEEG